MGRLWMKRGNTLITAQSITENQLEEKPAEVLKISHIGETDALLIAGKYRQVF